MEQMRKGLSDALKQGCYSFLHPDICPPIDDNKWIEQYLLSIKQPVNDGWRVYNTGVDITDQCTFEDGIITLPEPPKQ